MKNDHIQSVAQPLCPVCGGTGFVKYADLRDHMFGAPGKWTLRICDSYSCETLWLDPKPIADDIGNAYRNYYTHSDNFVPRDTFLRKLLRTGRRVYLHQNYGYPWTRTKAPSALEKLATCFLHLFPLVKVASEFSVLFLPFRPNALVLEVGCGSGVLLENLLESGWAGVKGLDFDSAAVEFARSKGLDVVLGGLDDIEYPHECFDSLIMCHVIEHLFDPLSSLKQSFELIKPGGRIVVVTPNSRALGRVIYGRHWRGLEPPRHLHIFSPAGLRELCVRAGFMDVKLRTTVRGAAGMFSESASIARAERSGNSFSVSSIGRAMGRMMQLLEMLVHPIVRDRGEELVLIALKPLDRG